MPLALDRVGGVPGHAPQLPHDPSRLFQEFRHTVRVTADARRARAPRGDRYGRARASDAVGHGKGSGWGEAEAVDGRLKGGAILAGATISDSL
jgi:hypothetical protein